MSNQRRLTQQEVDEMNAYQISYEVPEEDRYDLGEAQQAEPDMMLATDDNGDWQQSQTGMTAANSGPYFNNTAASNDMAPVVDQYAWLEEPDAVVDTEVDVGTDTGVNEGEDDFAALWKDKEAFNAALDQVLANEPNYRPREEVDDDMFDLSAGPVGQASAPAAPSATTMEENIDPQLRGLDLDPSGPSPLFVSAPAAQAANIPGLAPQAALSADKPVISDEFRRMYEKEAEEGGFSIEEWWELLHIAGDPEDDKDLDEPEPEPKPEAFGFDFTAGGPSLPSAASSAPAAASCSFAAGSIFNPVAAPSTSRDNGVVSAAGQQGVPATPRPADKTASPATTAFAAPAAPATPTPAAALTPAPKKTVVRKTSASIFAPAPRLKDGKPVGPITGRPKAVPRSSVPASAGSATPVSKKPLQPTNTARRPAAERAAAGAKGLAPAQDAEMTDVAVSTPSAPTPKGKEPERSAQDATMMDAAPITPAATSQAASAFDFGSPMPALPSRSRLALPPTTYAVQTPGKFTAPQQLTPAVDIDMSVPASTTTATPALPPSPAQVASPSAPSVSAPTSPSNVLPSKSRTSRLQRLQNQRATKTLAAGEGIAAQQALPTATPGPVNLVVPTIKKDDKEQVFYPSRFTTPLIAPAITGIPGLSLNQPKEVIGVAALKGKGKETVMVEERTLAQDAARAQEMSYGAAPATVAPNNVLPLPTQQVVPEASLREASASQASPLPASGEDIDMAFGEEVVVQGELDDAVMTDVVAAEVPGVNQGLVGAVGQDTPEMAELCRLFTSWETEEPDVSMAEADQQAEEQSERAEGLPIAPFEPEVKDSSAVHKSRLAKPYTLPRKSGRSGPRGLRRSEKVRLAEMARANEIALPVADAIVEVGLPVAEVTVPVELDEELAPVTEVAELAEEAAAAPPSPVAEEEGTGVPEEEMVELEEPAAVPAVTTNLAVEGQQDEAAVAVTTSAAADLQALQEEVAALKLLVTERDQTIRGLKAEKEREAASAASAAFTLKTRTLELRAELNRSNDALVTMQKMKKAADTSKKDADTKRAHDVSELMLSSVPLEDMSEAECRKLLKIQAKELLHARHQHDEDALYMLHMEEQFQGIPEKERKVQQSDAHRRVLAAQLKAETERNASLEELNAELGQEKLARLKQIEALQARNRALRDDADRNGVLLEAAEAAKYKNGVRADKGWAKAKELEETWGQAEKDLVNKSDEDKAEIARLGEELKAAASANDNYRSLIFEHFRGKTDATVAQGLTHLQALDLLDDNLRRSSGPASATSSTAPAEGSRTLGAELASAEAQEDRAEWQQDVTRNVHQQRPTWDVGRVTVIAALPPVAVVGVPAAQEDGQDGEGGQVPAWWWLLLMWLQRFVKSRLAWLIGALLLVVVYMAVFKGPFTEEGDRIRQGLLFVAEEQSGVARSTLG